MASLIAFILLLLVAVIAHAAALMLGARWVQRRLSWPKAVGVILLLDIMSIPIRFAQFLLPSQDSLLASIASLVFWLLLIWAVLLTVLKVTPGRTIKASLPYFAASILMLAGALALFRPFISEFFSITTMSIGPTLLPAHVIQKCPSCGGPLAVTDPEIARGGSSSLPAVCLTCKQAVHYDAHSLKMQTNIGNRRPVADRIAANKLLTPRRWDIVCYTSRKSGQIYVHRVIGMPGETIRLADGKIIVNGQPVTPPDELAHINWSSSSPTSRRLNGAEFQSSPLGADEYFVIGDAVAISGDSRYFGPIKKSEIVGVVDLRYLPLSRFHIFR